MTWEVPEVSLGELERRAIVAALERKHGNVKEASTALGIDRSTLYDKLKRYEIIALAVIRHQTARNVSARTVSQSASGIAPIRSGRSIPPSARAGGVPGVRSCNCKRSSSRVHPSLNLRPSQQMAQSRRILSIEPRTNLQDTSFLSGPPTLTTIPSIGARTSNRLFRSSVCSMRSG